MSIFTAPWEEKADADHENVGKSEPYRKRKPDNEQPGELPMTKLGLPLVLTS